MYERPGMGGGGGCAAWRQNEFKDVLVELPCRHRSRYGPVTVAHLHTFVAGEVGGRRVCGAFSVRLGVQRDILARERSIL